MNHITDLIALGVNGVFGTEGLLGLITGSVSGLGEIVTGSLGDLVGFGGE